MPEDTTMPETTAETAPPEATTTPPAPTPPAPSSEEFDPERAMSTIRALREEVKRERLEAKEAKKLREQLAAIEAEKLTEAERVQRERDEAVARAAALEATNKANAVKLAVFAHQQTLGVADAELALAALDTTKIEFDDTGEPVNVADLLTDLLERKPLLRANTTPPPPPRIAGTDGGTRDVNPPDLTADELEAARATGMDPERFAALKRIAAKNNGQVRVSDAIAALGKRG